MEGYVRIAAALHSFPFFWVWEVGGFLIGLFLIFSAFWGRGLGCSFLCRPAPPPRSGCIRDEENRRMWHGEVWYTR